MLNKISLFVIGCLIVGVMGCGNKVASDKIQVVTTIGMISDLTKNIAGDTADVTGLMGPGVDPHLYVASERDVVTLAKADVIFYNGLHLEARMGEVLEKMESRSVVVKVTDPIPESRLQASPDYEGLHDPHVWFDVQLWRLAAEHIRAKLTEHYPQHKDTYLKNFLALDSDLAQLDAEVRKTISALPKSDRILVTAHDAFGYFGAAYGFEVVGLQGLSTQTEAGTQDVQNLAKYIIDHKIKSIFVESAVPERTIKAVQRAVQAKGWEVTIGGELFADAMGTPGTEEGTYIGMVRHNVHTIVEALK